MEILNTIKKVFKMKYVPDIDEITATECEDSELVLGNLVGKNWHSIVIDDLGISFDECLNCLSPIGFYYYSPGFMKLILEKADDSGILVHSFLGQFAPSFTDHLVYLKRIVNKYNEEEKEILIDFFNYLRNDDTICPHIIDVAINNVQNKILKCPSFKKIENWLETKNKMPDNF